MRWLVGDIQGCAREFERLLARIDFDESNDELWCLGDLINRGPHSLESLELWQAVNGRGILGNHDVYALLAHAGTLRRKNDTLDALMASPKVDELMRSLRELPVFAHLSGGEHVDDVWIVHAGLDPRWGDLTRLAGEVNSAEHDDAWLASEAVNAATRLRCCNAAGETVRFTGPPKECPQGYRPWDDFYSGSSLIVHGHWARRGYYRGARTMGLDSGCVYGGALTAWCQEEDRIVQVQAV